MLIGSVGDQGIEPCAFRSQTGRSSDELVPEFNEAAIRYIPTPNLRQNSLNYDEVPRERVELSRPMKGKGS